MPEPHLSRTIDRYDIKFYTLVTQLIICKCGKFHEMLPKIVSTIQESTNARPGDARPVQRIRELGGLLQCRNGEAVYMELLLC